MVRVLSEFREHPRFGFILGIFLKGGEKLKNGQEVFINYGYIQQNEFPHDLPWYWRMKAKADIELEVTEKKKHSKRKKTKRKSAAGQETKLN